MILVRSIARIGVRTVELHDGRYYLALRNRTYYSRHEVPQHVARRHYEFLLRETAR